jgi:hypothetical protein
MNKSEAFGARCTPMERRALVQIAQAEAGGSTSEALRLIVREAADQRGLWKPLVKQSYEKIKAQEATE